MRNASRIRGVTLVEMMAATAILCGLTLTVAFFVRSTLGGLTTAEGRATMSQANAEIMDRIQHELVVARRIFDSSTAGNISYGARVPTITAAPLLSSSHSPRIRTSNSLAPSTTAFASADSGNILFFAQNLRVLDLNVLTGVGSRNIRIDTYRFNQFYLTEQTQQRIGGRNRRVLMEWRSVPYADATQILAETDPTTQANLIAALQSVGVNYAWDTTQNDALNAFYDLSAGVIGLNIVRNIVQAELIAPLNGVGALTGGSFRWGVSPNTSGTAPVPLFSLPTGELPSGFEVMVAGAASSRRVLVRLVMAAEGSFKGLVPQQLTAVVNVADR